MYIRQYLHDIEWFEQMQGEHPRFAHLWRTSFCTSRRGNVKERKGGGRGGGRRKGSPKRSASEADSTNSGSSHARGPGIKQLIGVAVSISSLTSLEHEGKRNSLFFIHLGFPLRLFFFFCTCSRFIFGNPLSYCNGVPLLIFYVFSTFARLSCVCSFFGFLKDYCHYITLIVSVIFCYVCFAQVSYKVLHKCITQNIIT